MNLLSEGNFNNTFSWGKVKKQKKKDTGFFNTLVKGNFRKETTKDHKEFKRLKEEFLRKKSVIVLDENVSEVSSVTNSSPDKQ